MNTILERLQNWYLANCNDDWEHTYGITISNCDNPGWIITIDLEDTYLQEVEFQQIEYQNLDKNDWGFCHKEVCKFKATGGPQKLNEILSIFLNWAESHAA